MPGEAWAARINVSVDRNPVGLDESFQIQFSADESPDGEPDFSPLEQDFDIISQSSGSSMSWLNGKASKTVQWTLTVMARQPGSLAIPAINFGSDASQPLAVVVTPGKASARLGSEDDIMLEVEATPKEPFVQSQIIYTVRIYAKVEIARAALNDPELDNAVIEKLGDDSHYATRIKDTDYAVTERKYALFPQQSGTMTIKPLVLNAEVLTGNRPGFNGFFGSQMTRNRRIASEAVALNVKPAPANFTGTHWLSAEQLVLSEEWSGDAGQMKVGEPLTRTLTLVAKGTTVGQLPELNAAKTDGRIKQYPDQPVLNELKKTDGLMATRQEKIALMLSNAGSYTLPAIEIPWFNTRTQAMEVAKIPARIINAAAAAGSENRASVPNLPQTGEENDQSTAQSPATSNTNFWMWLSIALALGWLATLAYFLRRQPAGYKTTEKKTELTDDGEPWRKQLQQACAENDADAAKKALLAWGSRTFRTNSLSALAPFCEARLRDEILLLNQMLYSRDSGQWQGKKLFQAFVENKARKQFEKKEVSPLEPLYRL